MKLVVIAAAAWLAAAAQAAAVVGEPAPPVALPHLLTGEVIELESLRGKVVYVDFWASWCAPCRRSMPELDALREELGGAFEVYAVNVDEDSNVARAFLQDFDIDYPLLADPGGDTPARYGIKGMPTGFLLDRNGIVRHVHEGYRPGDQQILRDHINALLQGE